MINSKVWCEKTTLGIVYRRNMDLQKWIRNVWISGNQAWFV